MKTIDKMPSRIKKTDEITFKTRSKLFFGMRWLPRQFDFDSLNFVMILLRFVSQFDW